MTGACLIDTNVLIDFLGHSPDTAFDERVRAVLTGQPAISIITTIELLGWRRHTAQSRASAASLLACMQELPLTRREADTATRLRSQLSIRLGDAIIAATALTVGLPLMTRNTEDFRQVDGLQLINPFAKG